MSAKRLLLALLVGLLVVPAALAGGTLTKAQVIAQGSAICKAGERKVNALPPIKSQDPFAKNAPRGDKQRAIRFLAGYASALDGVRVGLAELRPPAQGRALFEGFVRDLKPTVATFRSAHADAVAGRYAVAMRETQTAFGLFAKASRKTKAYGFPRGVCQSGSS